MKTFLKILVGIIILVALYALIAIFAFDKKNHFERSVVINAPKEKVWQHLGSLKEYNVWDPFSKADKDIVITYSGAGDKVGDSYHWKGNNQVGEGEHAISELVPNEKMITKLHFIKPFEGDAVATFTLTPEGNGTKVTWAMDNELNTMMKIMKPMMDRNMTTMFDQGLADLKKVSEQ
ncbi:SRPBCC family protein [Chryseobacterium phocaeense]|uniref:SRPBCC family protein n=1 Tax=Chryseobacterium phocaeense TaxID=1816690 RepID=UPI0009BA5FC0|nr:SRPBCC family protein [Chryseobacterium phocaeense]